MDNVKTRKARFLRDLTKLCKKYNASISSQRFGLGIHFEVVDIDDDTDFQLPIQYVDKTGAHDIDQD